LEKSENGSDFINSSDYKWITVHFW